MLLADPEATPGMTCRTTPSRTPADVADVVAQGVGRRGEAGGWRGAGAQVQGAGAEDLAGVDAEGERLALLVFDGVSAEDGAVGAVEALELGVHHGASAVVPGEAEDGALAGELGVGVGVGLDGDELRGRLVDRGLVAGGKSLVAGAPQPCAQPAHVAGFEAAPGARRGDEQVEGVAQLGLQGAGGEPVGAGGLQLDGAVNPEPVEHPGGRRPVGVVDQQSQQISLVG
ncbi:MAG: hypothetical protein R3F60_18060 [bacterium]